MTKKMQPQILGDNTPKDYRDKIITYKRNGKKTKALTILQPIQYYSLIDCIEDVHYSQSMKTYFMKHLNILLDDVSIEHIENFDYTTSICKIKSKKKKPLVFHNGELYDPLFTLINHMVSEHVSTMYVITTINTNCNDIAAKLYNKADSINIISLNDILTEPDL